MPRARLAPLVLLVALVATSAIVTATASAQPDVCAGPLVKLDVYAPDGDGRGGGGKGGAAAAPTDLPFSTEFAVVAAFGGLPPNATAPRARLRLRLADPVDACGGQGRGGGGAGRSREGENDEPPPPPPPPPPPLSFYAGAYVLAARGSCSFADKYDRLVRQMGAAGMLMYDDRPGCIAMGAAPAPAPPAPPDAPPPAPPAPPPPPPTPGDDDDSPPALSLDHARGLALAELVRAVEGSGGAVEVEAWSPDFGPPEDAPAMLLLWLLATGTVVGGALWSGRDHRREAMEGEEGEREGADDDEGGGAQRRRQRRTGRRRRRGPRGDHQQRPIDVTPPGALWFVFVASASLLAVWLLRGPVVAMILTALFALGGAQGAAAWLSPSLRRAWPRLGAARVPAWAEGPVTGVMGLPPVGGGGEEGGAAAAAADGGATEWQALPSRGEDGGDNNNNPNSVVAQQPLVYRRADLAAALLALLLAASWLAADLLSWRGPWWAAHDCLAVSLLLQLLRLLRLPSFKAACALLPLALAYDVFWVFLQPRLFGGDSVMVDVATQGGGWSRPLPLLLRVPSRLLPRSRASAALLTGLPASILPPDGGDSLLGFGDVVLPGMLAALARRVDVDLAALAAAAAAAAATATAAAGAAAGAAGAVATTAAEAAAAAAATRGGAAGSLGKPLLLGPYLPAVVAGYGAGLAATFCALKAGVGGEGGQPALLYLSPAVLLAFAAAAWSRGEMGACWCGRLGGAGGEEEETGEEEEEG